VVVTCSVWGAVPVEGATESQLESLPAVKVSVPLPVFVTLSDDAAGVGPPMVYVNESEAGVTDRIG
jgi:hypothetical protein